MKYELQSHKGGETIVVKAETEQEARTKAMEELWGPPNGIYKNGYQGIGLMLRNQRT